MTRRGAVGRRAAIVGPLLAAAILAAAAAAGACRRAPSADARPSVDVSWTLSRQVVGPATLIVTLRDAGGAPVTGAAVRVEGHMTHPGMTPIQAAAAAADRARGVYQAEIEFTMAGDWVLLVSAVLPGGQRIEGRIDVAIRQAG